MRTMFNLVLFDLDGTLVDTAPEIADTINDVLEACGHEHICSHTIRNWIGHGARETMLRAWKHTTHASDEEIRGSAHLAHLMELFSESHHRHCGTRSQLFPGVVECLKGLQKRCVATAMVTNKEERFVRQVLAVHRLTDYFDTVVAGDSFGFKKPDPATVQHCLQVHGVEARHTVLVGDSSVDAATARNAGIAFWAVPYGYNGGQPIADEKPDRILATLAELPAAIGDCAPWARGTVHCRETTEGKT